MNPQHNQPQQGHSGRNDGVNIQQARSDTNPNRTQHTSARPSTLPFSQNIDEQKGKTLSAALEAIDAHHQKTSIQEDAVASAGAQDNATNANFRSDTYNHMIGGGEIFNPLEYDPSKWGRVEHLGALEKDKEFRDFVKDASFVEPRHGREPAREDVIGTINYADKFKKRD